MPFGKEAEDEEDEGRAADEAALAAEKVESLDLLTGAIKGFGTCEQYSHAILATHVAPAGSSSQQCSTQVDRELA